MKTEIKAIMASVVVIALCLTAVSGVTYSWFSDSEQADITVTSGTIDITGILTTTATDSSPDTQVSIAGNEATITNLVANRNIPFTFAVSNESTIDTVYRAYLTVTVTSANENGIFGDVLINGENLEGMKAGESKTFYFEGSANSGVTLEASTDPVSSPYSFNLTTVPELEQQPIGLTIAMTAEAFQADYEFTPAVSKDVTLSSGAATISGVDGPVTVSGIPVSSSNVTNVKVEFTDSFSSSLDGKTITVSEVEETNSGFNLISSEDKTFLGSADFSIPDVTTSDMGLTYVSMTVSGEHAGVEVYYYNETESTMERMNVTDISHSGGNTVVTFITTHFSKYTVVGTPIADVDGTKYYSVSSLETALNTGSVATLLSDINENITITNATGNLTLDLNGHTINSGDSNTALIIENGNVSSVMNGKIVGKYYGIYLKNNASIGTLNCDVNTYYADAVTLDDTSKIDNITGGTYHGYIVTDYDDPIYDVWFQSNVGLYISTNATVGEISGGEFQGTGPSFRNYGTLEKISGGKFLNPLISDTNTIFGDQTTYNKLFFNNGPDAVTGGTFFNGESQLSRYITEGYTFEQSDAYVEYSSVTSQVSKVSIPDGAIYFYTVVPESTS